MQFVSNLVGESGATALTAVLALIVVLALAVLGLWLVKLTMRGTANLGRGRNRRLGVVEQVQVDARRQLLLIRRDDVEHVILIGGGQDIVVESGISVRAASTTQARDGAAESARQPAAQTASPVADAPATGERIRQMTRAAAMRQSASLRHTGLMRQRPATEPEIIPPLSTAGDKSGRGSDDSATTPGEAAHSGRTGLAANQDFGRTGRN